MKALSIMQPWAWLIVSGYKSIENRAWSTSYRGPVLIHAGKKLDRAAADDVLSAMHPVTAELLDVPNEGGDLSQFWHRGGIVGECEIVDCVSASDDDWFVGPFGFVIRNARPLPFRPCKGALGFFEPDYSTAQVEKLKRMPVDLFGGSL